MYFFFCFTFWGIFLATSNKKILITGKQKVWIETPKIIEWALKTDYINIRSKHHLSNNKTFYFIVIILIIIVVLILIVPLFTLNIKNDNKLLMSSDKLLASAWRPTQVPNHFSILAVPFWIFYFLYYANSSIFHSFFQRVRTSLYVIFFTLIDLTNNLFRPRDTIDKKLNERR